MKPESVDDGSLEKLAEKAVGKLKEGHAPSEIRYKFSRAIILSVLSEATAALEEKVKKLENALVKIKRNASTLLHRKNDDCGHFCDYRSNLQACRDFADVALKDESANATTPTPVLQVGEGEINALIREALQEIEDHALVYDHGTGRVIMGKETARHYIQTRLLDPLLPLIATRGIVNHKYGSTTRGDKFPYNPDHACGTCVDCGEEMIWNVPRLGPNGGFVHKNTGEFLCKGVEKVGDKQPRTTFVNKRVIDGEYK